MSLKEKELYEFGEFRLDIAEHSLVRFETGERLPLTEKAFETLCVLVRNAGHLVNKNELMNQVWADSFVEENNLNKCVHAVRRALGDKDGERKFIETVKKHGFRFVAEVRRVKEAETSHNQNAINSETKHFPEQKFPYRVEHSERQNTGTVIALANRRPEPKPNQPKDSNGHIAKLELIPTNPVIEHKPKHRIFITFWLIFAALAGIGYGLFNYLVRYKTSRVFQAGQITRLTSSGRVKATAVSPDGKFIIYAQAENYEQQSLWIQHIGSESNVQIAPPASIEFNSLNISPDSNSLYYHDANGTLYRMAVLGGTPKKVADKLFTNFRSEQISISPDSKQIAFVRNFKDFATALFIADADGTNERRLASFEQPNVIMQFSEWSPDGKFIACMLDNAGSISILTIQVADGTISPILQVPFNIGFFTWMSDSKSLMACGYQGDDESSQIWQISYPDGEARQITRDTNNYEKINLTSDGRFLSAMRTEQVAQIWIMAGNDVSRAQQLTAGFEKFDGTFFLGWMPNGKIVYDSTASGKLSGWAIEADGVNAQQLLKDVQPDTFSPDGRYLVYQKGARDNIGLWRTDLKDGSEKQLTKGVDVWATFSPDGEWIVYTAYHERVTISRVSVDGGEPKIIYDKPGLNPKVSPDGKKIVFTSGGKISLISFEGGEIIKTFDAKPERLENSNKKNLQWTPDGLGIYFIALNEGVSNIWRQPIDGSAPVQVTKFETGRIFNFAYSPDGNRLALSRGSLNSDVVLIRNANY